MNTNKKRNARLSNDSVNYRCSSLRVNLSCASDLTDSGNESLKHTDVECRDNATASKVKCIACLRSNESRYSNKKRTFLDRTCVSDVPLKNASVILERINRDDAILNKSCERLKTAILMKTREMFEEQNELSVKTCTVLTSKDVRLGSGSAGNMLRTSKENVCTVSDNMNNVKSLNERTNATPIIDGVTTDKCMNEGRSEQKRHDRYKKKKRLFVTKDASNGKNINDNSLNSKLRILKSNDERRGNNDTMTRTTENSGTTLNTSYKLVSSSRTGSCGSDNFIMSEDRSISISNVSKDEDTFMATPIACSTMINEKDDEIFGTERKTQLLVENNLPSIPNMRTKRDVTSMEITDVCEGFISCDKPRSFMEHVKKDTSANCPRKGSKATMIDRDTERNTDMRYTDASVETESANTEKTSLNVNTSMDLMINRSDESTDKRERECKEKEYPKFGSKRNEDAGSSFSKRTEESINTVCTSLQMNTSLNIVDTVRESDHRNEISGSIDAENETRDANENNTGTTGNVYKTKDRNSFKRSENCFNDEKTKFKERDKVNGAIATDRYDRVVHKIRSDGPSYIEATPYPMYRSVVLSSRLRQNAESCSFQDDGRFDNDKSELHNFSDRYSKDQEEMKENTVISNNSSHKRYGTKSRARVIVPPTNENKSEEDANLAKVDKNRRKKRLMPLNELSRVSLSPVEKRYSPPPRCLTFRKKLLKRKNESNKIDTNGIRHDEVVDEEKTCNEKKNRGKKAKKIVSKKIVVKKIVNQEILKRLEENRENFNKSRIDMHGSNVNSSNDFQSSKGSSTTRCRKKKTLRISIVMTGLSNDDKGIVKSVVKALGSARIESNVTKRTTHVVTTGVRTINLLHGIIRGCWIVGLDWVLKSLENDVWLNPREYEMMHFSKAVLENRKDRQLFGSSYIPELFAACGYIHIENDTTPPCNVLKDLVKTAGGCITENPEIAKVIIGTEGLRETWIFDCITSGELQPYDRYVRS